MGNAAILITAVSATLAHAGDAITPVDIGAVDIVTGRVEVHPQPPAPAVHPSDGRRLLLARGIQPLGLLDADASGPAGEAWFRLRRPLPAGARAGDLRGWLIAPNLARELRPSWPVEFPILARIDSVGPGQRCVWIAAGRRDGIIDGDGWWLRRDGQPFARFDIRLLDDDLCFCGVTPLVADVRLAAADVAETWPAPADGRTGALRSAVSFERSRDGAQEVWIAAPPGADRPVDRPVDFFRRGAYVGHGVVERGDGRFLYIRSLPAAGGGPIEVGDDAVIRGRGAVRRGALPARVFQISGGELFINAGEFDGLALGDRGAVWRDGRSIVDVQVVDVESGHARVRATPSEIDVGVRRLEEVRFAEAGNGPTPIGIIESVVDGVAFAARFDSTADAPLRRPLSVRSADGPAGVAVLIDARPPAAVGVAVDSSLRAALAAGMQLFLDPPDLVAPPAPAPMRDRDTGD
jgi:hypothetical protein